MTYDHRDPYEAYSDRRMRRNYGEPVPFEWDRFRPDRITYTGLEGEMSSAKTGWVVLWWPIMFGCLLYGMSHAFAGKGAGGAWTYVSPLVSFD